MCENKLHQTACHSLTLKLQGVHHLRQSPLPSLLQGHEPVGLSQYQACDLLHDTHESDAPDMCSRHDERGKKTLGSINHVLNHYPPNAVYGVPDLASPPQQLAQIPMSMQSGDG